MADTNIGTAYVKIMPSAKGISGEISKQMGPEAKSAGSKAGKSMVGAIKGIIAGAAIGKFFKDSIDAGAELEQNLGGTEAVFGNFAKTIQESADEAYKNMGMSASDYMATANKMGSLFQGSGLSQQKSLELTSKAMQRAADVASVMGLDTSAAMESIAGAAKGNFTMMDNLGVAMNATTLAAYALEKGVNFDWNTASNAEKAELAMQMFMERTAQYEGNFARESEETFSGSLGAMKSAATNFMATLSLGGDIEKPLGEMVDSAKVFLFNNLIPMVWNIIKEIPGIIGTGLTNLFTNLPGMVDSAISFINGLTEAIKGNDGTFMGGIAELASAAIEAFKNTDWIGLGSSVLTLLWEGIQALAPIVWNGLKTVALKAWEFFKGVDWPGLGMQVLTAIGNAIGSLGRLIWDALASIGNTAKEHFANVDWAEAGANAFHALVDAIVNIGSTLWDALTTIATTAGEHFKDVDWAQVGQDVINGIINGIVAIGSFLYEGITTLATSASDFFRNVDWEQAGKDAVTTIANGLTSIGTFLWDAITTIATTAKDKLSEIDWAQAGIDLLTAIKDGIVSIGSFLWGALQELGSMAKDKLLEIDWISSGVDIINGVVDGIISIGSNIKDTLVDLAKGAWNALKDFFAIGSPSKLMRDTVGKWIPLGIAAGIEEEAGAVTDAMEDIAMDASGVNITPTINGSASLAGDVAGGIGNVIMNVTVNGADNPEDWGTRLARQLTMELRMA